jgi:hypothetical protein
LLRPAFDAWRGWNIVAQAFDRVKGALQMAGGQGKRSGGAAPAEKQDGFALSAHSIFGDFSLRAFLETCLAENERRLAPYDPRLLRPMLVPSVVRQVVRVLPKRASKPHARDQQAA